MKNFELMGTNVDFSIYKSKDVGIVLNNNKDGNIKYLAKIFKNGKAMMGVAKFDDITKEGLESFLERLRTEVKQLHKK